MGNCQDCGVMLKNEKAKRCMKCTHKKRKTEIRKCATGDEIDKNIKPWMLKR